jgi:NADPH:quinone reductase-like Zn-dependent oxidoreductase
MRAVVNTEYGGPEVLRVLDVERPAPARDEVLVEVHATTVNRTDCGFRAPEPWFVRLFAGLRRPRRHVLGTEFAGVVAEVGSGVKEFAVGDEVFGVNSDRFGAHAEYLCVRERAPIAAKPATMTFTEAAAVTDGAILAMTCLEWAHLRAHQRILVYGASGSIGTAGVQLARHLGAHVTAVCTGTTVELVRALGADDVIDHTVEDFTANGQTYDVVFDAVGKRSFREVKGSVKPGGSYVSTDLGPCSVNPLLMLWTRFVGSRRAMMPLPRYTKDKVLRIRELIESGHYRAVIDRTYPLEQAAEATRYVETGQKTGNVVLVVRPGTLTGD